MKKIFAMVLALAMILSCAACGGSSKAKDDLLEEINDILGKDSQLDLPGLQMTFAAEDGRVHMQSFDRTFWDDTPWIRDTFLAQR